MEQIPDLARVAEVVERDRPDTVKTQSGVPVGQARQSMVALGVMPPAVERVVRGSHTGVVEEELRAVT